MCPLQSRLIPFLFLAAIRDRVCDLMGVETGLLTGFYYQLVRTIGWYGHVHDSKEKLVQALDARDSGIRNRGNVCAISVGPSLIIAWRPDQYTSH